MKYRNSQVGFSIVEIIIVVVVIGVIGLLGYKFYGSYTSKSTVDNEQASSQSATANDVKPAPIISDVAGLDEAEAVLDQTNPSGSNNADASQLDAEFTKF